MPGPAGSVWCSSGTVGHAMVAPIVANGSVLFPATACRQWWWRDIAGYLVFITALSLLYVLVACCLDAQAATAAVAHSSSRPTTSCSTSSFVPRLPYHSEAYDAPSADAYSKLQLVPSYATARQAAAVAAPAGDCMAPAQCSNTEQPTLRQLLYNKAAAAVAGLDDHRSSLGMSMLRQPKLLLRQAPLLFLWRLWFMADMFLVAKLGMAFLFLMIALVNPGRHDAPACMVSSRHTTASQLTVLRSVTNSVAQPPNAAYTRGHQQLEHWQHWCGAAKPSTALWWKVSLSRMLQPTQRHWCGALTPSTAYIYAQWTSTPALRGAQHRDLCFAVGTRSTCAQCTTGPGAAALSAGMPLIACRSPWLCVCVCA